VAKLKRREMLKVVTLTIILFSAIWMINVPAGHASKTLVVPQDYSTISEAISHASDGDTVVVQSGVYNENLQIDKPLTLEGQNKADTVIMGKGGSNPSAVLTLAANGITISGFTIESVKDSNTTRYAYGIWVEGDKCKISDNLIQSTYLGIFCSTQQSTTITNNIITGSIKDAIRFCAGSQTTISYNNIVGNGVSAIALGGYSNTVEGNNLQDNTRGLGLGASNSVVFNNTMVSNSESGIFLSGSDNVIVANEFAANKYGVYITTQGASPKANQIYQNNFVNNFFNAFGNSPYLVENWDGGSQTGGNFWSDYQTKYPNATEVGNSGIENTAYTINSNNLDKYPLTALLDMSNPGSAPAAISPNPAKPNSVVALWSFDNVDSDIVAADSTGNNPAVLGSVTGVYNYTPARVEGKFGEALSFNGNTYAAVQPSPSLEVPNGVTVDVWVNIPEIKLVPYDNILIEALRTTASLPTRTFGVAVNGEAPINDTSPPLGALRAYVRTTEGFSEIDTKDALPLNTWVHVVFVRSTTTGMHLYVDGKEQAVTVAAGTANPAGPIQKATDIYIGHDSITEIDQLQISNTAQTTQPLWMQWWLWTAIIFAAVALSGFAFYVKKRSAVIFKKSTPT
jgi:parallel beta-helix repeat protein